MVTTMAIAAKLKLDLDIPGVRWEVTKGMSSDKPRRIVSLAVEIWLPFSKSIDPENILEKAALACPVQQSLNPYINCPVVFHWDG